MTTVLECRGRLAQMHSIAIHGARERYLGAALTCDGATPERHQQLDSTRRGRDLTLEEAAREMLHGTRRGLGGGGTIAMGGSGRVAMAFSTDTGAPEINCMHDVKFPGAR